MVSVRVAPDGGRVLEPGTRATQPAGVSLTALRVTDRSCCLANVCARVGHDGWSPTVVSCAEARACGKGHRRAFHVQELENAEQNYAKALELSPEDKGIKKALAAVRREIAERNAVQSSMFKGMFAKK